MRIVNEKSGAILIGVIFIAVISAFFLIDPIAQDLEYHSFSDTKGLTHLPNTLNVL